MPIRLYQKLLYRNESQRGSAGKTLPRTSNQKGQSLVEYMILLALVVLVCVGTTKALGHKLHSKFREIRNQIDEGIPVRLNP
jgi:Flp pilus assembly pilin Flp